MMVNTRKSNKQQQRKKLKGAILWEERNSRIEKQFEEPQPLDQSKRVFWHRTCNWTSDFSVASKECQFLSVQNPHQIARNHISYVQIKFPQPVAPTKHQTFHRTWHDPLDPKDLKHMHPQQVSYRTMEEEIIHRFLVTTAHTTPIRQRETPKHKII